MKSNTSTISWAVVAMAACSLFSMIGTFRIDGIINHDLYQHGLQFSYAWAIPYWTTAAFVFAMGWLNLIIAAAIHMHTLALRRKASIQAVGQAEKETTKTETVEKPEEEKPKLIEGAREQPIEMQVRVPAHFVEISAKEGNEVTQTVTEEATVQEQNQTRQSGQVEEQTAQEPESYEETITEQEESKPETLESTAAEDSAEQTAEQAKSESEQPEETARKENEETQSPAESTTEQEGTEQEQLRESEETPVPQRPLEP